MPLTKPYPHVYRPGATEPFKGNRKTPVGKHFLLSFEILKGDFRRLIEFIEPHADNYKTYSQRTFELLLRACTEVESNFKQIFSANNNDLGERGNIKRYSDLEPYMKLSEYVVGCPAFNFNDFSPFESFKNPDRDKRSPDWYQAYNRVKHNRVENFSHARLEHVIRSIGAVLVIIAAQYCPDGFAGGVGGIGGLPIISPIRYFVLSAQPKWSPDEHYEYNWKTLKYSPEPYDYLTI